MEMNVVLSGGPCDGEEFEHIMTDNLVRYVATGDTIVAHKYVTDRIIGENKYRFKYVDEEGQ